ncbi:hypothetical protein H7H51_26180 [Mycolicibacterium farcinogenes]|nr:hypothetical protein [Mycolicibacterium farcinogenes]
MPAGRPSWPPRPCAAQVDLVIRAVGHPIDGQPVPAAPPTLNTTLELDADGYSIVARRWSRHPECPC